MRQVRFPLKLKLLTLIIILVAASLIVFVSIALQIFKQDKSAYIYETLLNKASSEEIILGQKLMSIAPTGAFTLDGGELKFGGQNVNELLKKELSEDSTYGLKIIVPVQTQIYEWKKGKVSEVTGPEKEVLSPMLTQSLHEAVKELDVDGKKSLYSYHYDPGLNFAYVVTLPQAKAFEVTSYLINKSLYYGLFILGISMLVSVLLARPLTSQLETLFGMTQEIAKGKFDIQADIKGSDEVGALSDSINDMATKIVGFMEEMKEKARLENEVAVAQLVQARFFPVSKPDDEIYGHFEPASECGGDWWGFFDRGDWRVLFIADATGHGVPAALLTATMNCCKTSLSFIMESRPEMISSPQEILRYMNQAVCGAGGEIQVTCFVASFNRKTREFIYSNASHTQPLLFSGNVPELSKGDFQPLMEALGPRLGQKLESTFSHQSLKLNLHDTIFFYTDGLTEADNNEGARWGERRLIKTLASQGRGTPQTIVEGLLHEFKTFTQDKPLSDDLTAVAMKVTL